MDIKSLVTAAALAVVGTSADADYKAQPVRYDFNKDHSIENTTVIGDPAPIKEYDANNKCLTGETGGLFERLAHAFSSGGRANYSEYRVIITDAQGEVVITDATTCRFGSRKPSP